MDGLEEAASSLCYKMFSESENNDRYPVYDPIGRHILLLREYYHRITNILEEHYTKANSCENNSDKNECETSKSISKKRKLVKSETLEKPKKENLGTQKKNPFPLLNIPRFPGPLPVQLKKLPKREVDYTIDFGKFTSEEEIKVILADCVKQILGHNGFFVGDLSAKPSTSAGNLPCTSDNLTDSSDKKIIPVDCLMIELHKFLRNFCISMREHKNSEVFSKVNNLWGPLETTLREINFGGIVGIHEFYYEALCKKHDILLDKCRNKLEEYQTLEQSISLNN